MGNNREGVITDMIKAFEATEKLVASCPLDADSLLVIAAVHVERTMKICTNRVMREKSSSDGDGDNVPETPPPDRPKLRLVKSEDTDR